MLKENATLQLQRKVFIGVLRTKNMTQITKRIRVVSYHLEILREKKGYWFLKMLSPVLFLCSKEGRVKAR